MLTKHKQTNYFKEYFVIITLQKFSQGRHKVKEFVSFTLNFESDQSIGIIFKQVRHTSFHSGRDWYEKAYTSICPLYAWTLWYFYRYTITFICLYAFLVLCIMYRTVFTYECNFRFRFSLELNWRFTARWPQQAIWFHCLCSE